MANNVQDIANKIGGNGSRPPKEIADALNSNMGAPLDIGRSKTALSGSGNALPPIKKGK